MVPVDEYWTRFPVFREPLRRVDGPNSKTWNPSRHALGRRLTDLIQRDARGCSRRHETEDYRLEHLWVGPSGLLPRHPGPDRLSLSRSALSELVARAWLNRTLAKRFRLTLMTRSDDAHHDVEVPSCDARVGR